MTDWNVGSGARNDLFVEVVQMANGHMGFGTYRALHHDGDGVDLLESGDASNEVLDEASLLGLDSISDDVEHQSADTRIVVEGVGYKVYPMNEDKHPTPKEKKAVATVRRRHTCYETVSSAHHRVQAWFDEKTGKYPMVFGHLRIT